MKKTVLCLAVLGALNGCTTVMTERTDTRFTERESAIAAIMRQQLARNTGVDSATTKVKGAYYGSKSIPLKTDLVLPEVFRIPKEFKYPNETFTLAQAAARISRDTGIPIRIAQDVYSINGQAVAQTSSMGAPPAAGAGLPPPPFPSALPTAPGLTVSAAAAQAAPINVATDGLNAITLDFTATPAAALDHLCLLNGLNWEYRNGVAVIQRLVTRVFVIKATPGSTTFDFSVGKSSSANAQSTAAGQSAGSIGTGFTSQSSVKKSGMMAAMDTIKETLEGVKTTYGKILPDVAAGTITVIDTIDGIDRAAKVIERQNDILSRRATFKVEIVSFKEKDNDQSGIDWNAVFQNFGKFGASITSPTTIANKTGGTLSMQLLAGTGSVGRFDGSSALVTLLNEYGKATTVNSLTIDTKNRVITPVSMLTQTVYLARTTPAASTAVGASAATPPGLEPGTTTTGLDIKLQPNIMDSNQISLMFSVGLVDLLSIKTITSGTGTAQQSIEAPETAGFEFQQEVSLQPGMTTVLSGYERVVNQFTRRTLGRDVPAIAGGSFTGDQNREKIFILITPTVVGAPN